MIHIIMTVFKRVQGTCTKDKNANELQTRAQGCSKLHFQSDEGHIKSDFTITYLLSSWTAELGGGGGPLYLFRVPAQRFA